MIQFLKEWYKPHAEDGKCIVVVLSFSPITNPYRIKSKYKLFLYFTSWQHWLGLHQQR